MRHRTFKRTWRKLVSDLWEIGCTIADIVGTLALIAVLIGMFTFIGYWVAIFLFP